MAHRKQVPQPRRCQQCQVVFLTAHQSRLYCSSACNTRAWRARTPKAAGKSAPLKGLAGLPAAGADYPPPAAGKESFSKIAAATVAGNAIYDGLKRLFTPSTAPLTSSPSVFPTWPPAELLAGAGTPIWVTDPTWQQAICLTPVTYHKHQLYLYVEAGLTRVLWKSPQDEWDWVTTPAELAHLAAHPPIAPEVLAALREHMPGFKPSQARLSARVAASEEALVTRAPDLTT
jgi:ribosomal protein S27AE